MAEVTFIDHLRELKRRLTMAVLLFLICSVCAYYYAEQIYQFLLQPLLDADEGAASQRRLIYTNLTEAFFSYIKLACFAGFIMSFPFTAAQIYRFLAPALYQHERRVLIPFLLGSPLLFTAGMAMAYYGIFPLAWKFFLGFEVAASDGGVPIVLEAKISEYLALVTHIILAFGIAFQFPLVLLLLVKVGVIDSTTLRTKRKYAVVAVVMVSAFITPPEVLSQLGLAIPLLLLYEITIVLSRLLEKRQEDDAE